METIVPGGFGSAAVAGSGDFDQVGLAVAVCAGSAFDSGFEFGGGGGFFALDALGFREFDEVDIRIAEVHADVFAGGGHLSVVGIVGHADGLIVFVVVDDGEDGDGVARLGPEAGGAVHDGAVTDGADDLAAGGGDLGSGGCADSPTEAEAGVGEIHEFVFAIAEGEGVVLAGEVLADDDGVLVEGTGEDGSELVGVDGGVSGGALDGCGEAGTDGGVVGADGRGAGSGEGVEAVPGGDGIDGGEEVFEAGFDVADERDVGGVVAAHGGGIHSKADDARGRGEFGGGGDDAPAGVAGTGEEENIGSADPGGIRRKRSYVVEMDYGEVAVSGSVFGDGEGEFFGKGDEFGDSSGFPDFVAADEEGALCFEEEFGGLLDGGGVRADAGRREEAGGGEDFGFHVLALEGVVGHGEVDGAAGRGDGDFEGAAQHEGKAGGLARFPTDFGELTVDFFLVVAGTGGEDALIAPGFVVVETGGDNEGGAVACGVVHLPGGLGGAGDDVDVDEGGFEGDAVVAIGHGDDDAFVEGDERLEGWLVEERVEEGDFVGAGVGEDIFDAGGFGLGDDEVASGSFDGGGGRRTGAGSVLGGGAITCVEAGEEFGGGGGGESQLGEAAGESATGEVVVEIALDEVSHGRGFPFG